MDKPTVKDLSEMIIKIALRRAEQTNHYTQEKGRWVYAAGYLAGWLARIALTDFALRKSIVQAAQQTDSKLR